MNELKTIDITAKTWRDKINGNMYFSARVIINYGMSSESVLFLPFQYGGADECEVKAIEAIKPLLPFEYRSNTAYWLREYGIIVRKTVFENQKKRDVIAWGKGD